MHKPLECKPKRMTGDSLSEFFATPDRRRASPLTLAVSHAPEHIAERLFELEYPEERENYSLRCGFIRGFVAAKANDNETFIDEWKAKYAPLD